MERVQDCYLMLSCYLVCNFCCHMFYYFYFQRKRKDQRINEFTCVWYRHSLEEESV